MTSMRIFIYGSMCEGMVHFSKIQNFIKNIKKAKIKGTAYRLKVGFPVVTESGEDAIEGQLCEMESSDLLLALLDEFHGFHSYDQDKSLFHRKMVPVITDEEVSEAFVYFINPKKLPKDSIKIKDGQWVESIQADPLFTAQLSERQTTFLRKLNQATGRDIVPIHDMSLYRELIKLDLIVDKGRRVALSKLGKEVCRYLE